jgi:8-oxo-dGTP diphosphatase
MTVRNVSVLILYDHENRILLQHRTKDAPTFPDYWGFFGGTIEEGESAEQAVKREAIEELGYELTNPRPFTARRFVYRGNDHLMHVFIERYDGRPLILREGQDMGWFRASETSDLIMNEHDRSVVEEMKHIFDS